MKITLNFETKEIEVLGKVNVEDLFKKVEELNLDTQEWSFISTTYTNSPGLFGPQPTTYPLLGEPLPQQRPWDNQIWY